MSTTTAKATINANAQHEGWTVTHVAMPDAVTRYTRAGAIVLVTYTSTGAVRKAEFSPRMGEHTTIGARDAGKRETVLSWIEAPAGYPTPGVDVPVQSAPVVDPYTRGNNHENGDHTTCDANLCDDAAPVQHTAHRFAGSESVAIAHATVARDLTGDATNTKIVAAGLSWAYSESTNDGERAYFARRHDADGRSALDVYRVTAERDADASNPRDDDNLYSWTLSGGSDYLDIDENDTDGIGALWSELSDKYDAGVAFEIVRLVAKGKGGVVFPLDRNYDGSVSIHDYAIVDGVRTVPAGSKIVRHPAGYAPNSWHGHRFIDRMYGSIDGVAYVSAARIAEMMGAGSTGAGIVGNLKGEVSMYSSWASGDCWGAIVERATVLGMESTPAPGTTDERDLDINMLDYDHVESCWGYYGDEHRESGLAEFAADVINADARERETELASSLPQRVPAVTAYMSEIDGALVVEIDGDTVPNVRIFMNDCKIADIDDVNAVTLD